MEFNSIYLYLDVVFAWSELTPSLAFNHNETNDNNYFFLFFALHIAVENWISSQININNLKLMIFVLVGNCSKEEGE